MKVINNTIGEMIYQMRDSEKPAVICGNETVSYRQLWIESVRIARALARADVKKGDRVAIDIGRSTEYILMMVGIALYGAVGVTLDYLAPEKQRQNVLDDSNPVLIVNKAQAAVWRKDESFSDRDFGRNELSDVSGEDPFWIVYTSGSTGAPKGSVIYHRAVITTCASSTDNIKNHYLSENCERLLLDASFSYVATLLFTMLALCNQKTAVLATDEEIKSLTMLGQCIVRNEVDYTCRPQSWIMRAVENPDYAEALKRIKLIDLGGEKNTDDALKMLKKYAPNAKFFFTYGSSEILMVTSHQWDGHNAGIVGQPLEGNAVYLLDESGNQVDAGMTGEICFGGIPASLGRYWNAPELTEKKYEMHPVYGRIYHMGDMGRLDSRGQITIIGRIDSMIKIHGVRIEPEYPERVLKEYPGIHEAVVIAAGNKDKMSLYAYYTSDSNDDIDEMEIRHYLAETLPFYMIPAYFIQVDEMPLNSSGKLDRKKLLEVISERSEDAEESSRDNSPEEELLCNIFSRVLKFNNKVGRNDNFFELGGDSIAALEAAYLIEHSGYSFEIKWLYAAPIPSLLSKFLAPAGRGTSGNKDKSDSYDKSNSEWERQKRDIEKELGRHVVSLHPVSFFVEEQLDNNNPWMRFAACATTKDFSRQEWEKRILDITQTHEMLRSVFLKREGKYLRAVLSDAKADSFYVDISHQSRKGEIWSKEQRKYYDALTQLLLNEKSPIFGTVLFKAGYIRIAENVSILLLYYSHSILDTIGVNNLIKDILEDEGHLESDNELFEKRTERILHGDRSEALQYWKGVCADSRDILKLQRPNGIMKDQKIRIRVTGDAMSRSKVNAFCEKNGVSFASFMHTLVGRTLIKMSGRETTVFLSTCSGRNQEEIRLSGMFAGLFPFRFSAQNGWGEVQEQLINAQKHFWLMEDSEMFKEIAGAYEDTIRLDIVEDSYGGQKSSGTNICDINHELKIKEFLLQNEIKKRHPQEDDRPYIYVNRLWPELYVIEFTTGTVDVTFIDQFQEIMKKELCRMTEPDENGADTCLASVLTPLHEKNLSLVKRAFASLKAQRFGFKNLEWVILLHNCSENYKKEIHHLFDKYDNIRIEERDVPGTSLQYARSELLGLACGKYLFFMDGDDEMTPYCVSKSIEAMEESGADLATWAVTIRSGDYDMMFCCDADPSKGNLVLEKGDPRIGSTLCFSGPGLWAHVFRRSFLQEKNIRFNANSRKEKTCQDVDFVLDAVLAANRVLIMPNLTGYIYYYGIGMFNEAGTQVVYDLMDLVRRYKNSYRDAGLAADNLIWAAMSIGLLPQFYFVPESMKTDYLHMLEECFSWLSPPKMNWSALQKAADSIYNELKKMVNLPR
ncbi:MAG: AMP-binding protein [Lachnospiraceae bacterium]|nr:AMP-binding protein [Lachnospiraceae bacterium]